MLSIIFSFEIAVDMLDYMDEILTLQQSGNGQLCTCIDLVLFWIMILI